MEWTLRSILDRFAVASVYDRYLREPDGWSRRRLRSSAGMRRERQFRANSGRSQMAWPQARLDPHTGRPALLPGTRGLSGTIVRVKPQAGATMDVGDWLRSLGLGQYEAAFRDNETHEAGRDGFWLARFLARRGIEVHVIEPKGPRKFLVYDLAGLFNC